MRTVSIRHSIGLTLALIAAIVPTTAGQTISYPDFSSVAGLALNGTAVQAGNVLNLNPATAQQVGTAWHTTQQSVASGFVTDFTFRITPTGAGADGMSFIIHNDAAGTAAIAQAGGSLGYTSEPLNPALTMINLLVIEIDTWNNGNFNDPNDNHISVHLIPTLPTTANGADEFYSIGQATPSFQLADGNVHAMCITYTPGLLTIYLDDFVTPLLSIPFDFVTGATSIGGTALGGLNLPNGTAYVGFTGATGGVTQVNDVLSWSFGGPGCPVGPWETNSPASALDIDGAMTTGFSAAVTTTCVGASSTLTSVATTGSLFDIAITQAASGTGFLTTPGGQRVNIDLSHPSIFSFNGGVPTFAGVLNLVPHPGSFTFSVPTGNAIVAAGQQLATDPGHPDGFELSQSAEINIVAGGSSLPVTLPDDGNVQVMLQTTQLCATSVDFYGTTYTDLYVNSNGDVSFTQGHSDFTATSSEWQSQMPRIGLQADLEPNNFGTVTVTNNGAGGTGSWITISYANVTEWGTGGLGVTSYNIELHGPNGHEIGGFTTDGTWGVTPVVVGMSLGAGGTHPALVVFDSLTGAGLQANVNPTDSVIDESTTGMIPWTTMFTSIQFPFNDGSAFIVQ